MRALARLTHAADVMGDNEYLYAMSPAQLVYATEHFALGRSNCPAGHPHFGLQSEPQTAFCIAFHRTCVRLRVGAAKPQTTTPNNVSLLNPGDSYSREAIGAAGDDREWIAMSPQFLRRVITGLPEVDPLAPRSAFRRSFAPVSASNWVDWRRLLLRAPGMSRRDLETALIELVRNIVSRALDFWCRADQRHRSSRPSCHDSRARMVEGAMTILVREFRSAHPLTALARQLDCSLAHLSRAFQEATGLSLCAYRNELRLRNAMLLLEQSDCDVREIASYVGASSPSHFTQAFAQRFHLSPSKYREHCKADNAPIRPRPSYFASDAVQTMLSQ